jgi:hypothetical protein
MDKRVIGNSLQVDTIAHAQPYFTCVPSHQSFALHSKVNEQTTCISGKERTKKQYVLILIMVCLPLPNVSNTISHHQVNNHQNRRNHGYHIQRKHLLAIWEIDRMVHNVLGRAKVILAETVLLGKEAAPPGR